MTEAALQAGKFTFIASSTYKRGKVVVQLECSKSGIQFLELEIEPNELVKALGGLANVPCQFRIANTENVGKKYEYRTLSFNMELKTYGKKREAQALKKAKELCPDGWHLREYLGSQNSFKYCGESDIYTVNIQIYRWVDE